MKLVGNHTFARARLRESLRCDRLRMCDFAATLAPPLRLLPSPTSPLCLCPVSVCLNTIPPLPRETSLDTVYPKNLTTKQLTGGALPGRSGGLSQGSLRQEAKRDRVVDGGRSRTGKARKPRRGGTGGDVPGSEWRCRWRWFRGRGGGPGSSGLRLGARPRVRFGIGVPFCISPRVFAEIVPNAPWLRVRA